MAKDWKPELQGKPYALRKSNRKQENQELERHYGVSSRPGPMKDTVRYKRFGHPESAEFAKGNIVELTTDKFGFPFNRPIFVHRAILGKLSDALEVIRDFVHGRPVLGESASTSTTTAAGKTVYKITRMHGYDFRYARSPKARAEIRKRDRAGQYPKAEAWFNEQVRKHAPGFESFARRRPYSWNNKADISVIAAAYDCFNAESGRPRGPQQGLSKHAFGLAIDINPATNGLYDSYLWDMPIKIVQIMVHHGFYWGGFFTPHDPMHFQYEDVPAARPIVANREQARFFFPFNPDNVVESPVKYYFLNECKERGGGRRPEQSSSLPPPRGFYALGLLQNVHGGIHLQPRRSAERNVRVMTDGYIVAARLIAEGAGGFSKTAREFVAGQDLGFVVVRHEFVPLRPGDKKKAEKRPGGQKEKPDEKAGKPEDDRFKDADIIYSLYMHLAPPGWGALDADRYAREVPWFQKLLRLRHGGVVDIDPLSPKLGTMTCSTSAPTSSGSGAGAISSRSSRTPTCARSSRSPAERSWC
jgi:hypothetical protein